MTKPTVFFSHSSKDRELMLKIKDSVQRITGGVLDIFLSSDGQSIPFGSNWIHRIEEGLNQASIMFVFVTPNSISSNWIYFEAGFAYSKKIEVIPVGVGIDIAVLDAPLSLLQGFNVTSGDALNNFISIINKKFDYHFEEKFLEEDYINMSASQCGAHSIDLANIFEDANNTLYAEYGDENGGKIEYDIEGLFNDIKAYCDNHDIKYAYSDEADSYRKRKRISVYGLSVIYKIGKKQQEKQHISQDELDKMLFTISPYHFERTFNLFIELMKLIKGEEWCGIDFNLRSEYAFSKHQEDIISIISMYPEEFSFIDNWVDGFAYGDKNVRCCMSREESSRSRDEKNVVWLGFRLKEVKYQHINNLISSLVEKNVIYRI